jgi:hypothetical protein
MIYDDFGENSRREYDLFVFALTGRYLTLVAPGIAVSPMSIYTLRASGSMLRKAYLQSAFRMIDGYAQEYASARSEQLALDWRRELERITEVNIESLVLRLKGAARSELSLLDNVHGAMGTLLQQRLSSPELVVPTASGREYKAGPLVGAEARDFAYRAWLDSELERIAVTSDLAEVIYPSADHEGHGRVFSISGATIGYPSFALLEEDVFHFNANAMVKPHVST